MNRVYEIQLGLESAAQNQLLQELKSAGSDVIQTSSGLCAKSTLAPDEMRRFVTDLVDAGTALTVRELGTNELESASPDVRHFCGS